MENNYKKKLVSVIIPAYNAGKSIQKTIDSIRQQTYKKLEIIVVDDGSQDGTADIVNSNSNKDNRIKFLRQQNLGVAAARNLAIEHAKGEFVAPCDADDLYHPQKIEKQIQCITASNENVGLIYAWIKRIDENDQVISYGKKYNFQGNVIKPLILTNFVGGGSTPLIRHSCIDAVGNYSLDFKAKNCQGSEDWDLYLRIAGNFHFKLVPLFLLNYRITKNSMSHNTEEMIRSIKLANEYAKRRYYRIYPGLFRKKQSFIFLKESRASNFRGDFATSTKLIYNAILKNPIEMINPNTLKLFTKNLLKLKISDRKHTIISNSKHYKASMKMANLFYDHLVNRQLSKLCSDVR